MTVLSSQLLGQSTVAEIAIRQTRERFAGLHFDFHAQKNDTLIGETFSYAMVDSLLSIVQPDFIQVDCKGHQGFSSYPTKVGNTPGKFKKDILRIWRDATAKHGIPLFVHYSGVLDNRAIELHPSWARMGSDSSLDKNAVSVMSPYLKELMIPQLKELALAYDLDGAWIDGDCWALGHDYSPAVLAAFRKTSGNIQGSVESDKTVRFQFNEFNRKIFRDYVNEYVNAVHAVKPGFRITSNWSFSSIMPEPVDVPVDFLSGDVAGTNSLYSSAFESRCMALQGKPWDLMSWSFVLRDDFATTKSVLQLEQEGAEVLAMGGGFQTYWQQHHDGSVQPFLFDKMAEIIRFSQARKKYCYQSTIVPQIGLLYSTYAWKRILSGGLYSSHSMGATKGILEALLNSQLPVEILMDHQLAGRLEKYPLIILPQWENIDPAIYKQLLEYVKNGGKLIVVGAAAVQKFEDPLGIRFAGQVRHDSAFYAGFSENILHLKSDFQPVTLLPGTVKVGASLTQNDWRFPESYPLATIASLGKGQIAGIYFNSGDIYHTQKNSFTEQLLHALIDAMKPNLISTITGSNSIHQVISKKAGNLYVHLINISGPHDNPGILSYDALDALHNITVHVKISSTPREVLLQPGDIKASYTYHAGQLTIKVPELLVYNIIEIK